MQQIEPSHQPRRDAKLPVITGAAAKNAGDADADLDEEGGTLLVRPPSTLRTSQNCSCLTSR